MRVERYAKFMYKIAECDFSALHTRVVFCVASCSLFKRFKYMYAFWEKERERLVSMKGQGGQVDQEPGNLVPFRDESPG